MLKTLFNGQLPKAIFFDLDGTLIDSVPDLACAIDNMLIEQGYAKAGEQKSRTWVGNGARILVQRALADAQHITEDAVDKNQLNTAHQQFIKHYANAGVKKTTVYPGVKTVLKQLQRHGVRMAIITNKPAQFTPSILANLKLAHFFEIILGGDSLPTKKPDPAPLLYVMNAMHLPANECLMVGDSQSDITAANAAGVKSVCVTYGYNYGEDARTLPATAHIDQFLRLLS